MFRKLAIILVASLLALPAAAKERTWTSADGRTMKAEFVREVDGVVTFLRDGKLVTLPLDSLSEKDQQIIRDLAMGKPVPDEEEPASDTESSTPPAASGDAEPDGPRPAGARIAIDVRTWTDDRGNKMQAKFVRMSGTNVVLNRAGRIQNVSYYSLSEEDQKYIRDLLTQQGKAGLIPPPRSGSPAGDPALAAPGAGGTPPVPEVPGDPGGIGPGGIPGVAPPPGFPGAGGTVQPPPIPGDPGVPLAGAPFGSDPSAPSDDGTIGSGLPGGPAPAGGTGLSGGLPRGRGFDTTPPFGGGANVPASVPDSSFPQGSITPGIPSGGAFQPVLRCTGCNREISQEQSQLGRCPYCKILWVYKEDGSGRKEMTAGGARNMMIGAGFAVVVVVFAGVAVFIGILVAVVRAVSGPARPNYRRY